MAKVMSPTPVTAEEILYIKRNWIPYAQSAYCTDDIESWTCLTCTGDTKHTTNVTLFGGSMFSVFGYAAINIPHRRFVLSFRGTRTLDNWLSDLMIAKPDYELPGESVPEGAKIHYGFLKLWESVKEEVLTILEGFVKAHPGFELWVTGHSMGGAVATLAAVDIMHSMDESILAESIKLLTIAQPRIGNTIFASWVNTLPLGLKIRLVNQDDLTPHLPPAFADFLHNKVEMWIANEEGETLFCDDDGGDNTTPLPDDDVDDSLVGGGSRAKKELDAVRRTVETPKRSPPIGLAWGQQETPDCANRIKWRYNVLKHLEVWNCQIGSQRCFNFEKVPCGGD
ncbi:hypothetical protein HDV05_000412 [Chytridiales sp. JEL 0842]|nr:hypothetical protein HDV05_000412 [Chytridiales sp. JEL 0842]